MNSNIIHLEVIIHDNILTLNVHEPNDEIVTCYEKIVDIGQIDKKCRDLIDALNRKGRKNHEPAHTLENIKLVGKGLGDLLFTPEIKKYIRKSRTKYLYLSVDAKLVNIPWELICIDEQFLCESFAMGRSSIKVRHTYQKSNPRKTSIPMKMWIITHAAKKLTHAAREGQLLCDHIDLCNKKETIIEAVHNSEINSQELIEQIRQYDFIHFAGHAEYNSEEAGKSGWLLKDGMLHASDIKEMEGGAAMPFLVFSNACQSARTESWFQADKDNIASQNISNNSFGLANAFMLSGVKHYIGTLWEIMDEPGSLFSIKVYDYLLSGKAIGEAVQKARIDLIKEYGPDLCWASYVLYGNPSTIYFENTKNAPKKQIHRQQSFHSKFRSTQHYEKVNDSIPSNEQQFNLKNNHNLKTSSYSRWILFFAIIMVLLFFGLYSNYLISKRLINTELLKTMIQEENRKNAEIKQKIKEIEQRFGRNIDSIPVQVQPDQTISKPVSLAVILGDTCKSFNSTGTGEMIAFLIEQAIQKHFPRIKIVDRMTFDDILDELTISLSKLVHPKDRIVPEIMPAHILLTINVGIVENAPYIYFRLKQSKSGLQLKAIEYQIQESIPIRDQINKISSILIQCLKENYDIKGAIDIVYPHHIQLNIGQNVGIEMHQMCNVIGKDIQLKVISVKSDSCGLTIVSGNKSIKKGMLVQCSENYGQLKNEYSPCQ
jgi:CHAT domain-containing protein